jgi:hypothetical protein
MKQPINEIKRMQQLAGLISEAEDSNYKSAALELVKAAKNLIEKSGESLVMNSEVKKASMATDADKLSDLYYHLSNILGDLIGSDGASFPNLAKNIIVDKYNLTITDEYGSPMKWR